MGVKMCRNYVLCLCNFFFVFFLWCEFYVCFLLSSLVLRLAVSESESRRGEDGSIHKTRTKK